MATLESDVVHDKLTTKLHCKVDTKKKDHDWYFVHDVNGMFLSRTFMSKGAKHTLRDTLVVRMAKQLGLGTSANFVNFVGCSIEKDECLTIIRASLRLDASPIAEESAATRAAKAAKAAAAAKIGKTARPRPKQR
jgi:hypothetical protein